MHKRIHVLDFLWKITPKWRFHSHNKYMYMYTYLLRNWSNVKSFVYGETVCRWQFACLGTIIIIWAGTSIKIVEKEN